MLSLLCAVDNEDCTRYYDNDKSYYRIRRISDALCREHQLSVIQPSGIKGKKYNEWKAALDGSCWKQKLRKDINDSVKIADTYEGFIEFMRAKGYEVKTGKYISFRPSGKGNFVRGKDKTLGGDYTKERICKRIVDKRTKQTASGREAKNIRQLIDMASDPKFQDNVGLKRWASKENLKRMSQTYNFMVENQIENLSELEKAIKNRKLQGQEIKNAQRKVDGQIRNLKEAKKYAGQYLETKAVYQNYQKAYFKDRYFRQHESEIIVYEAAERYLKRENIDIKAIHTNKWNKEYQGMQEEKLRLEKEYKKHKAEQVQYERIESNMKEYLGIQENRGKEVPKAEKKLPAGR